MTVNTRNHQGFGDVLRAYRIRKGTTQRQLADLAAVSVRTIRNLELGRVLTPRPGTVELIADALRLTGSPRDEFLELAMQASGLRVPPWLYPPPQMVPAERPDEIVGRHAEMSMLSRLVTAGGKRLVTVTGIAGVGKSRLATEVIRELPLDDTTLLWSSDQYPAKSPEPSWLAQLVKDTISGQLSSASDLAALVANRPTVLVLDGYDVGPESAERIKALLRSCGRLRMLVTSRAPADLDDETVYSLAPLEVPDVNGGHDLTTLSASPTTRLLVNCARVLRPSFAVTPANAEAVAALCRITDGIPAVVERMATWLTVQDPDDLLECIRSDSVGFVSDLLPELWESLDRTVTELTPDEEAVLGVLADKNGDCSLGEAADVSGVAPLICARAARRLMAVGLVRPTTYASQTRLEVLGWVRALLSQQAPAVWLRHGGY